MFLLFINSQPKIIPKTKTVIKLPEVKFPIKYESETKFASEYIKRASCWRSALTKLTFSLAEHSKSNRGTLILP